LSLADSLGCGVGFGVTITFSLMTDLLTLVSFLFTFLDLLVFAVTADIPETSLGLSSRLDLSIVLLTLGGGAMRTGTGFGY
jgi:hypothetical protein